MTCVIMEHLNQLDHLTFLLLLAQRSKGYNFKNILYFSLKIIHMLAKNVDPEEIMHSVAFYLILRFLIYNVLESKLYQFTSKNGLS